VTAQNLHFDSDKTRLNNSRSMHSLRCWAEKYSCHVWWMKQILASPLNSRWWHERASTAQKIRSWTCPGARPSYRQWWEQSLIAGWRFPHQ